MKRFIAVLVVMMLFSTVAVAESLATPTDLCDHEWSFWVVRTKTENLNVTGYESVNETNHEILFSGPATYSRFCIKCGASQLRDFEEIPDRFFPLLEAHEMSDGKCVICGYDESESFCDHVWSEWLLLTDTEDLTVLGYEVSDKWLVCR